jgi:hypothetical protein
VSVVFVVACCDGEDRTAEATNGPPAAAGGTESDDVTSAYKRRRARRKLKAHDRGEDRHNKGLAWIKKQRQLAHERNSRMQLKNG